VEIEVALECREAGLEEAAGEEREADRRQEEDDQEDVGDGRAEIAEEFALKERGDLAHGWEKGRVGSWESRG
jgi:hypothetical protein